ncbi:MAG: alkaline phosphatase family protein [Planctomycetota bacterium]
MKQWLFFLGAACAAHPAPAPYGERRSAHFDHVVLVSIDGLRSDALIAEPPAALPNFARLRRGASTLNARTDPDWTVTLPNHTSMLTGRLVHGDGGHGWTHNDEPEPDATLHRQRGAYVQSVLDVAHDHGLHTGIVASKTKFVLYDQSYAEAAGAPDTTGPDDGRDKLDRYAFESKPEGVTSRALELLSAASGRSFLFLHYGAPDVTAHAHGWDVTPGSKYLQSLARVDVQLGRLLDAIEASDSLRGKTALVLTADHGGGAPFKSHDQPHMWVDYVIPFCVWTGGNDARELYALNTTTRRDPGLWQVAHDAEGLPPIRNGDAANLVLDLLGLPPVERSTINAQQDLRWSE